MSTVYRDQLEQISMSQSTGVDGVSPEATLVKSRSFQLLNVVQDDEKYGTLKSALEPWSKTQGWTDNLEDAVASSSDIEAVLTDMKEGFANDAEKEKKDFAVQYLKFLQKIMVEYPRYEVVQELSSFEPPLYETADVLKVWEAHLLTALSTSKDPLFIISSADGTGTATTDTLTKADRTMHECAVVAHPPSLRRISGLAICVVNDVKDDKKLSSTLATAVRLLTTSHVALDADDTSSLKRIICAYNIQGGHFVLGVLDVSRADDGTNVGVMRFFDPTNMFVSVPAKPNSRLNAELLGLSSLNVLTQPGVMQQHDLCSSGPIVAENGLDYLKLGKGMRKPALSSIYPANAYDLRAEQLKRYGVTPATADPGSDANTRANVRRGFYYSYTCLIMIAKTAVWGKELAKWMAAKAEEAEENSYKPDFTGADDILMATRVHVEIMIRQNAGLGTLVDDFIIDLLFCLDPDDPGRVEWNDNTLTYLTLNSFTELVSMKTDERAERAEELKERYANVLDALKVLEQEHQENIAALNAEAAKSTSQRISELQSDIETANDSLQQLADEKESLQTSRQQVMDLLGGADTGDWDPNADMDNVVDDFEKRADEIDAEIDEKTQSEQDEVKDQSSSDRREQKQKEIDRLEKQRDDFLESKKEYEKVMADAVAEKQRLQQEQQGLESQILILEDALRQRQEEEQQAIDKKTLMDEKYNLTLTPSLYYSQSRQAAEANMEKLQNPVLEEISTDTSDIDMTMNKYFNDAELIVKLDQDILNLNKQLSSTQAEMVEYKKKVRARWPRGYNFPQDCTWPLTLDQLAPMDRFCADVIYFPDTLDKLNKEYDDLNGKITQTTKDISTATQQKADAEVRKESSRNDLNTQVNALNSNLGTMSMHQEETISKCTSAVNTAKSNIDLNVQATQDNALAQENQDNIFQVNKSYAETTGQLITDVENHIASIKATIPQGKTVIICSSNLCPAHSACLSLPHQFHPSPDNNVTNTCFSGAGWVRESTDN